MSGLIENRGVILGELISIMTRYPLIPVLQIIERALVESGNGDLDSRCTDGQLADALRFYNDKLHEGVMNAVVKPNRPDEGGAEVAVEAGGIS